MRGCERRKWSVGLGSSPKNWREGCEWCIWSRYVSAVALRATARIFLLRGTNGSKSGWLSCSTRLIPIPGILSLMSLFLFLFNISTSTILRHPPHGISYFSQSLPVFLDFWCLLFPLFANDLGYLRIGKSRMLGDDLSLVVLAIKDESYKEVRYRVHCRRIFGVQDERESLDGMMQRGLNAGHKITNQ